MEQNIIYEREIDMGQLFLALIRKARKIIVIGIIVALLIAGYQFVSADSTLTDETQITYQSVTDYVGKAKIFLGDGTLTATAEAARSYLTGNDVIQNVIGDLGLELNYNNIFNMINLQNSTDTMVTITVVGNDEAFIQSLTDSLSTIGAQKISEKFNKEVIVLEPAYTEQRQYDAEISTIVKNDGKLVKEVVKYAVIGFVLGTFLVSGVYLFLFMIDATIKEEKDIEGYLGVPVLGTIPVINGTKKFVNKSKKKKYRRNQYIQN